LNWRAKELRAKRKEGPGIGHEARPFERAMCKRPDRAIRIPCRGKKKG